MPNGDVLVHASKLVHLALLNEHEFSSTAKLSSLQMLLYMQAEFSIMREYKIAVVKKIFQKYVAVYYKFGNELFRLLCSPVILELSDG